MNPVKSEKDHKLRKAKGGTQSSEKRVKPESGSAGSKLWNRILRFGRSEPKVVPERKSCTVSSRNPRSQLPSRLRVSYQSEGKGDKKRRQRDYRRYSLDLRQDWLPGHRRERSRTNGFESPAQPHFPASSVSLVHTMMPSRSTPNLPQQQQQQATGRDSSTTPSIYSYLQNQSGLSFAPVSTTRDDDSPPPAPPVRDSSSLKSIKYGPGHEKFPSWPVPAAADTPQALRVPPNGGSHRSKSWTDHTNYPKEKVIAYTRPYMKRQHSSYTQQKLKTVMEKCEKIPPETFERRYDKMNERIYFPHVDHDGKTLGDLDYMVPSPPERDLATQPQLTQADLEEYARSYQEPLKYPNYEDPLKPNHHLTESGLEEFMEYTRNYEETMYNSKHEDSTNLLTHLHQKQTSYAHSEGYHSYVSSTDSTSTPFLDRLRRDSDAVPVSRNSNNWEEISEHDSACRREGRDSVVTTSSGSASSSETLKWHGSMSDVSVASSSCTHLANSSSMSRQLIAHSARVQTPQRHHSESVLYMSGEGQQEGWKDRENHNNNANKLKLFPVNTYTVQEGDHHQNGSGTTNNSSNNRLSLSLQSALSVADRISELEKQQKYSYLDPDKKHKVSDPTLKAIQKKALLSFYERHHNNPTKSNHWRSEPQLAQAHKHFTVPPPPPKVKVQLPSRRASSASDYASGANSKRSSLASNLEAKTTDNIKLVPKHQHSNSCGSLSTDLLGPVIMGPSISVDDWIPEKPPERPPKNPHLRTAFPDLFQDQRVPSPDLPPPSPPTVLEDEVFQNDEPLPPPPPELEPDWQQEFGDRLKDNLTSNQTPAPQVQKSNSIKQTVGIPERARYSSMRSSIKTRSGEHIFQQVSSKPYQTTSSKPEILGFPNQRDYAERSNIRYPAQKLIMNNAGSVAVSQSVNGGVLEPYKAEPLRREQRSSFCDNSKETPPPLQPRQMRVNQSMRARIPHNKVAGTTRSSPPKDDRMREGRSQSLSQSKASYLASRRDRDRVVPDSETGSYKRTMSPNGHAIPSELQEPQRVNSRETIWPLNRQNKDIIRNNNNLIRRSSMNDNQTKPITIKDPHHEDKEDLKKPNLALPDVLPVNVKIGQRSHKYYSRPTQLSLSPLEPDSAKPTKTPPVSPSKTPSFKSTRTSPKAIITSQQNGTTTPPKRLSPPIKPPLKLTPIRTFTSTATTTTPPQNSPPESPRLEECPKVIEGLQLIQRTEVVLRVNTCTTDASSQTEKDELPPTPLPSRKKLQEEIECEKLSEDFVNHLPTSDRLKDLLVPGPEHKKPTDYVYGLFKVDVTSRPRPLNSPFRSRNNTPSSSPPPQLATNFPSSKLSLSPPIQVPTMEPISPLSGTSTYFTTSEPKAKFLTRYSQDMNQCHVVQNTKDLSQKKEELVSRLDRKLEVLRGEQLVVLEESKINDELGENVESHVNRVATQHEVSKFRLHIEEVGKITSLLLGLSGRLARAENALMGMQEDHPEKRILETKRDKLHDQLEEAKKLKECIDHRSISVSNILYKYLNPEEYADYDHFINMKAKLIMDSKEIADKIKLGEEQLMALKETLIIND